MAAGLLVMAALVLGLAPAGADGSDSIAEVPEVQVQPLGPVSVAAGAEDLQVATDLPLPADGLRTNLALPLLPDLTVEAAPGASAEPADDSAPGSHSTGLVQAIQDAPPAAVVAGSSLLATLLGVAAWFARPAFGLFSRIEDDELAKHPLRRQALDFISANPGATLQDVRRGLGVAWGTAVYHLGRLERAGLVAVRHRAGRRGHWPLGQAPAQDALAPTGQVLALLVRERPGLAQNELARLAGLGAPAACKQLRRLESAGVVLAQRSGRTRLYVPTAGLDALLAKGGAGVLSAAA